LSVSTHRAISVTTGDSVLHTKFARLAALYAALDRAGYQRRNDEIKRWTEPEAQVAFASSSYRSFATPL
jgi:hypothetical protein